MKGVVSPRNGQDNADPEGLEVFLRLHDEHAAMWEMGRSGACNASIKMRCLVDTLYVDLASSDQLQNRRLSDVSDNDFLRALRREARIYQEGPSLAEFVL